jgi:hypothetical protein
MDNHFESMTIKLFFREYSMEFCASVIITQGGRPLQYSKGLMENCPKTFGAVARLC